MQTEVVIKAEINEYSGIAPQVGREFPAQLLHKAVFVRVGVYRAV